MNRYVIKVIGYWLVVIGYWLVVNVQCSTVNAQINPEIKALMAYADSMKNEITFINPSAMMRFDVGRSGLECQGRISFQYSYVKGIPRHQENPERIATQKQKGEEMLERMLQTLDRLSRKSIEATHWEIHGQNADTLNYAIYLRPGLSMFSLRNSTNPRYSPSAAFGGEYINMNYTFNSELPYYYERTYKKDEETGRDIIIVDSSAVASRDFANATLNYTYYLDSTLINNPNERNVQYSASPLRSDVYCDAIAEAFNRPGVTMRKVHYYLMEGKYGTYSHTDVNGVYRSLSYPFVTENDTYGLHYIIQSKDVAEAVMRDYWKATVDYMMAHPHEDCHAINPYRLSFDNSPQTIFYGQHAFLSYPLGWNTTSRPDVFEVRTAYSKGYYHILLLKTDGDSFFNLPDGWETIRDYDNGEVTYYEEDRE